MSKRVKMYRSEHLAIEAPTQRKVPKLLRACIMLSIVYLVCSVTIHTSELFATDSFSFIQSNNANLNTQYETLLEMYHSLEGSYKSLKRNYLDLRERYNDALVEKSTLLITNQQYIPELKELRSKVNSLQDMNEYVVEKLATQEKEYNDLKFTVDTYLDDYKKQLKKEQEETIRSYQDTLEKQYLEHTQKTKKPYQEYFYSSYNKK